CRSGWPSGVLGGVHGFAEAAVFVAVGFVADSVWPTRFPGFINVATITSDTTLVAARNRWLIPNLPKQSLTCFSVFEEGRTEALRRIQRTDIPKAAHPFRGDDTAAFSSSRAAKRLLGPRSWLRNRARPG